jgi:hypothetical protein
MLILKEEAQANATQVKLMAEAEANKFKLTPEFLHLEAIRAIENSPKVRCEQPL